MNIRKDARLSMRIDIQVLCFRICAVFAFALFVDSTVAGDSELTTRQQTLQRMRVLGTKSYVFDFSDINGITGRSLVELVNMGQAGNTTAVRFYLFGLDRGVVKPKVLNGVDCPLRWALSNKMIFVTREFRGVPPEAPWLLRYPLEALVIRPDGTTEIEWSKFKRRDPPLRADLGPRLDYTILAPIAWTRMGLEGWKEGDGLVVDGLRASQAGIPIVHYDVRALDDVRVELYMTVNGKFSKWVFDGKKWTLSTNYPRRINGPFLICNGGSALVAEVDGHWCLVRSFDKQTAEVSQIAKKTDNEPFVLVEDIVARKNYFQYKGTLYDENRVQVSAVPSGSNRLNQLKSVVDSVRSRRQK